MEILKYITENALVLIPALYILGEIIKGIRVIDNKWIPMILLPVGIVGAMALGGWSVDSAIQGILVTGATVYGDQVIKQIAGK